MENKNICIDLNKVIKGDVIYYPINELIHREQIMRVGNILLWTNERSGRIHTGKKWRI